MTKPSFVDRYRWWLFLGAFAINVPFYLLKIGIPELAAVYSVVNVLSAILLVAGIAGFFNNGHRKRQEKADTESLKSQGSPTSEPSSDQVV